ncbi:hypothetical protein UPYG_G00346880 [Umbra pygmaea]|uniref:Uncharacterized protein n=1 Tax=Umbra pygmaea TaxID=75934 RepID=A0ABD0W233_UMBPY
MEMVQPFAEKYLMKLTFFTKNDALKSDTYSFPTYTVNVRVTNKTAKPLTRQNLHNVAVSVPELHYRLNGRPYATGLLHLAFLEIEPLTPDFNPLATVLRCPKCLTMESVSRTFSCIPLTILSVPENCSSEWTSSNKTTSNWLMCDGSFVPDFPGNEWTSVNYHGREFIRAFSPIRYTDDTTDILGRCNIREYTVYEQFVFSVDMDILKAEDSSDNRGMLSHHQKHRG